jgi:hypothetical protein
MNEHQLRIAWMRAALRPHARTDVGSWTEEDVVQSFAALRDRPLPFSEWCQRLGMGEAGDDADGLVAHVKASAAGIVTVEEHDA